MISSAVAEFNPLAPQMAVDPYPFYRTLREADRGVHHVALLDMYVLTRHEDVSAFYRDRRLEVHYAARETARYGTQVLDERFYRYFQHMAFALDNPKHRTIRQMFQASFTLSRLNGLRTRIDQIADGLIDDKLADGGMEFISDFAERFPLMVIGEMLGVPAADCGRVGAWARELGPAFEFLPMDAERLKIVDSCVGHLVEYFENMAKIRLRNPRDDLFTGMLHAAAKSDGEISLDMVIANAIILYIGGHETTSGAMGLSLLALHRQPQAFECLGSDHSLIPAAVEEFLRFDISTQGTGRVASEAVEYGGVEIPAGSMMLAYLGAALRDPAIYSNPDELDFKRPAVRLISFAPGAHQCVGHQLARMELATFLRLLLTRIPPGHRLMTLDPPFKGFPLLRGLAELPVEW